MNSANPPVSNVLEARELRVRANRAFLGSFLLVISCACFMIKKPLIINGYLLALMLVVAVGLVIASYRWEKRRVDLLRRFPLASQIFCFQASGHTVEVAFQFPPEFASQHVQERIHIAARAALRTSSPDKVEETLDRFLTPEIDELGIPVFRVQLLNIQKPPDSVKPNIPSIYI